MAEMISKHISLKEATTSPEAIRLGLDNTPGTAELIAMKLIAEKVFEPLREYVSQKRGKDSPIHINSFFRSNEVNKAIGGAVDKNGVSTSQHCKGEAMDIETNYPDFNNKDLFLVIKDRGVYDQLIFEFSDPTDESIPAWVHVSYKVSGNRNQVLRAIKENGKTKYLPFE
jgi:hypothetical protein